MPCVIFPAPSSPPTDFSLEPSENDLSIVHLMWMPPVQPNGALTGYLVLMSQDPELPDREWTVDSIISDRLTTTIGPLSPNITYFFKIKARNNIGYGPHSDILHYRVGQKVGGSSSSIGRQGPSVTAPPNGGQFHKDIYSNYVILFAHG